MRPLILCQRPVPLTLVKLCNLLLVLVLPSITFGQSQATVFFDRGFAKQFKSDYDGAIADYSKCIKLEPQNTRAYSNRGIARMVRIPVKVATDSGFMLPLIGAQRRWRLCS